MAIERFYIEKGNIVDRENPLNNGLVSDCDVLDSQNDARRMILRARLMVLFNWLIPARQRRQGIFGHQPFFHAFRAMNDGLEAVGVAICASNLRRPVRAIPIKQKSLASITSVSLFVADVEALLADLYGSTTHLSSQIRAFVLTVLYAAFMKRGMQIWAEYEDALIMDGRLQIPGYGRSGSDIGHEWEAHDGIVARIRAIRSNPTKFGKYARRFAKKFHQRYQLDEWERAIVDREVRSAKHRREPPMIFVA